LGIFVDNHFAPLRRIQRHDDALPVLQLADRLEKFAAAATDRLGRRFHVAVGDARDLLDAVHPQARFHTVDVDDQHARAIGFFDALHAKSRPRIDDR
jgi:hypothetical protein